MGQSPRVKDRNFMLGVANGIFVNAGETFLHSGLVLAPFLAVLGAAPIVIGLVPAIKVGASFLPQLLVANRISHEPLKLRFYHFTSYIRTAAYLLMTLAVFVAGATQPGLVVAIILAMLLINAVAGGIAAVPFADVTAKIVPHSRLGTFWALRNSLGGVLALGAGVVLRNILESDMAFPTNFGLVLLLGTILSTLAYGSFSFVKEPPGVPGMRRPFLGMLRDIPGILRADVSLRRFLRVRFLGLAALLAEPFYGVYAITAIGAPDAALGTYIIAATATSIISNLVMGFLSNRALNVTLMQVGFALLLATPILALLIKDWRWFVLVFIISTIGSTGVGIGATNLLYAIAPQEDRALYIGLSNTVLTLPSFAPMSAGLLLVVLPMSTIFLIAVGLATVTLGLSFRFRILQEADRRALERSRETTAEPATTDD